MSADLMLINGQRVEAKNAGRWSLVDPGRGDVIAEVPYGDAADAAAAIAAAAAAFPAWSKRTAYERGALLDKAADLIATRVEGYARRTAEESGKPLAQAAGEWAGAPGYLRFAAEEGRRLGGRWIPARAPGRRIDVTYQPLGVVGVITAWNFPVYNVNRAASSALAAGCTVVLRPSEFTPRSAFDYASALHDAGIPPGVFNVVNGDPVGMAQVMLDDPRCRKIGFTGSTRVGRLLMQGAARTVTRLSLELGGNAPVLVFPDVDVAAVAKSGVIAKLRNSGQVCIAPQRFIVHASVAAQFVEVAAKVAATQVMGHAFESTSTVGPLINAAQRERVEQLVDASVALGARVVCGGTRPVGRGFFYPPTVLDNVPATAPVLSEEVFGPVLPVQTFTSTDEALALANDSEAGLAAFVWTRDLQTAMRVSEGLECGLVGVNDWYPVTPEAPFGGMKQSGLGRESGSEGLHEYVEAKTRYFGGLG